jgi:hypothetical protein
MRLSTKIVVALTTVSAFSLFIRSWHLPHVLTALGVVAAIATKFAKGWQFHHWGTLLGAVALAGISTWLKYGGPDFQIGDTPLLGFILIVLRAMYQTPPAKT